MKNRIPIPISFIILNYNGKDLTERCIKSLIDSLEEYDFEVILVDNNSPDNEVEYFKLRFPQIKVIKESQNRFIQAYNDGVSQAKNEWVFLLNNDMVFKDDFIEPLLNYLNEMDLFAVGSVMLNYEGFPQKGVNIPIFRLGYIWFKDFFPKNATESVYIGTHGLFRKSIFLKLGGFDSIYSPFYVEDVDLCYRAWKIGYKIIVEPRSVIYHKHMGTIGRLFSKKLINRIYARNHIVFVWKNITSKKLFFEHILLLPFLLFGALLIGKAYYVLGFLDALKLAMQGKIKRTDDFKFTDEEVLSKWNKCA
ncbi:MAG: glycosyltransferase family 2 protein [Candidatus Rehaiarchaeum fermentans]|nr:glycosyltransferase [Candidatus Rehaiarchaeum fermentans]